MPDPEDGGAGVRRRLVVLTGGTSAAGRVAAHTLRGAGARVVVVGHDPKKLAAVMSVLPDIRTEVCDLTDETEVAALAERLHRDEGPVDGILHLVGGWRGGGGLAGQTEDDYRFLERSFTALRFVSRAFDADLRSSPAGRFAIVSSTAVARPLAGGANYASVKAASEAWTRAVAQGFATSARDAGTELSAAAVVFRVRSLDDLEGTLAERFTGLWAEDAASLNDSVIALED